MGLPARDLCTDVKRWNPKMEVEVMSLEHAVSGEVVNLSSVIEQAEPHHSRALVKSGRFETMIVQLAKGNKMDEHLLKGPLTVLGLQGTVNFQMNNGSTAITPNDWMFLDAGVLHSVEAPEDCAFLLTIIFPE